MNSPIKSTNYSRAIVSFRQELYLARLAPSSPPLCRKERRNQSEASRGESKFTLKLTSVFQCGAKSGQTAASSCQVGVPCFWAGNCEMGGIGSPQSLHRLGRQGDMRDDSAEILFQSFLREAVVSSSGMNRDVHSLMLPIQHFLR